MSERKPLEVEKLPLSGVHLIEASAGTGKTYTITSLLLRSVVESELGIERIAAVTFTNAATSELRERVGRRLREARECLSTGVLPSGDPILQQLLAYPDQRRALQLVERALSNLDRAGIFTIHGFAQRMLTEHAFESGARYEVELQGDQTRLVQDAIVDFWSARVARLPEAEFLALGGVSFFEDLRAVGKEASGAPDVELVPLEPAPDSAALFAELSATFESTRRVFVEHGAAGLAVLGSPGISRTHYNESTVATDFSQWRRYFESGQPTAPAPERRGRWSQSAVAQGSKKGQPRYEHPLFAALEELNELLDRLSPWVGLRRAQLRAELAHFVRARVQGEHRTARTQSFDDLLLQLRSALRHPERGEAVAAQIREAFPVVLIDEFQDTDPVQYEIFRRLFAQRPRSARGALFLIGDPKQSIYSFRGADVHSYLQASQDALGGVWTLTTSYRSDPRLVASLNALFSRPRVPFGMDGIVYDAVTARPGASDELRDARGDVLPGLLVKRSRSTGRSLLTEMADEVAHFLAAGHRLAGQLVTPAHLAVLTRTNADAQEVQERLGTLGIPAVMHGDRSVFEASEATELRRILRALSEPSLSRLTRAALITRFLGLDAAELEALDSDPALLEAWMGRFKECGEAWQNRGVVHALERLARETGLVERTLAEFDGERRITNYRHLVELLHEAETREHLGVSGLLRFLDDCIDNPAGHAMAAEARQLRLESDAEAVTLTTIHKSKGLEYEIVFLPTIGNWTDKYDAKAYRFHEQPSGETLLEVRDEEERGDSFERATAEERQEALRLAYVALTRAKHCVVALAPDFRLNGRGRFTPLGYFLHERSAPEPGGAEGLRAHLKELGPEQQARDEERLVVASGGALHFASIEASDAPTHRTTRADVELHARALPAKLPDGERTSSFSAMTRGVDTKLSRASREGRDVDEAGASSATAPEPQDWDMPSRAVASVEANVRIVMADFPRGAGPGEALHALFENSDFLEGDATGRRLVVERELLRRGIGASQIDAAAAGLEDVLATPLLPSGFSLGQLARANKRPELEFNLPVGDEHSRLSAEALARALGWGRSEPGCLDAVYLRELAQLPFSQWSGFLRGFIDLVFEVEGRLYVVDYKSNYLGETYADYDAGALDQAMRQHHYPLQALIYALAVHRHAQRRVAGYSYERGFGGVFYLFLRGMKPSFGDRLGVHFLRPSDAEIERLSAVVRDPIGGLRA